MNILGISAFYHDSAAALVVDGEIIAAAQEERFTRIKHDSDFPENAVNYCLSAGNLKIQDIDYVVFYEKTFIKFERILETYLAYAPYGIKSFIKSMPMWLHKKLWIREILKDELGFDGKVIFTEHHESHAASAFFPSPFKEAAFLTIDGVGEWATVSYGTGEDNKIKMLAEQKFPHSVGLLYSAFTYFTGFRVNSGEYKLMGLAPYGEPKYYDMILKELVDIKEDGSIKLNMEYFDFCAGLTMTSNKFDSLFGGKHREPESKVTQKDMDIASSIQKVTEEIMLRMTRHVRKETGMKNLCLAGGVALNCVGNGAILREGIFDKLWIQPASGDSGGALGAALFVWYDYLGNVRKTDGNKDFQKASYLGPGFDDIEIGTFLKSLNIPFRKLKDEELPEITAGLIADEKVIGWFQGRMEFGPRALGARSIIGDPRSPKMQEIMNLKIKFRESFRPFAPSVIQEHASEFFDIDVESPYMLLVTPVKEDKRNDVSDAEKGLFGIDKLKALRSQIPAVTHVDYSARIQTVSGEDNPLYHKMITVFYDKTGCPLIINTSFNVRGEPIVCTPREAYNCFMRTNMDYLILGNYLLDKREQKQTVTTGGIFGVD